MFTFEILLILFAVNGAPIIMRNLLGDRFAFAVDCGGVWIDGKPLFGPTKTWRGIASAVLVGAASAWMLGFAVRIGLLAAALSMLGDLLSSFIKRRFKFAPSGMALGLDQIPESLLPLVGLKEEWHLGFGDIFSLVLAFFALELAISQILFWLNIRKQPY